MEVKAGHATISRHTELRAADYKSSGADINALVEIVAAANARVARSTYRDSSTSGADHSHHSCTDREFFYAVTKALASPPRAILNLNSLHVFI